MQISSSPNLLIVSVQYLSTDCCVFTHICLFLLLYLPQNASMFLYWNPSVSLAELHTRIMSEYLVALETAWNDYSDNNAAIYHDDGDCELILSLTYSNSEEWSPKINKLEKKEMWIQGAKDCVREQNMLALLTKPLDTVAWDENFPKSEHPTRQEVLIKELVENND